MPTRCQNNPWVTPKWSGSTQKWSKITPKWPYVSAHFGPCMTAKRPNMASTAAREPTWKGPKTVKNSLFGHLMYYIASLSPGLFWRIEICGHWHHYDGLVISKRKNLLFLWKSRFLHVFFSTQYFFPIPRGYTGYTGKNKKIFKKSWKIENFAGQTLSDWASQFVGGKNRSWSPLAMYLLNKENGIEDSVQGNVFGCRNFFHFMCTCDLPPAQKFRGLLPPPLSFPPPSSLRPPGTRVVSLAMDGIVMQSIPLRNAEIVFHSIYCWTNGLMPRQLSIGDVDAAWKDATNAQRGSKSDKK